MRRPYILVTRLLCPFCLAVTALIVYDVMTPARETDEATVTGKTRNSRRGGYTYYLEAKGRHTYRENVSSQVFQKVERGDILRLNLTSFFPRVDMRRRPEYDPPA